MNPNKAVQLLLEASELATRWGTDRLESHMKHGKKDAVMAPIIAIASIAAGAAAFGAFYQAYAPLLELRAQPQPQPQPQKNET